MGYRPQIGQMLCTGGNRTSANAKSVGRSSAMYMDGQYRGQCAENALPGSWYSFPSIGECAPGWDVGFDGCTWKTESFKVISSDCFAAKCGATKAEELQAGRAATGASVVNCF